MVVSDKNKMWKENSLKVSFVIKGDYRSEVYIIPHPVLKNEWKQIIGKTMEGIVVLELNELSDNEFKVVIEVLDDDFKRMLE